MSCIAIVLFLTQFNGFLRKLAALEAPHRMISGSATLPPNSTQGALRGTSAQAICIETSWRWNCCGVAWPDGRLSPLEQCGVLFESLAQHGGWMTTSQCHIGRSAESLRRSGIAEPTAWSEGSEGIFDVLLQPGPNFQRVCEVSANRWRSSALEVLLLYQEGLFEWLPPFRWLLAEILPAMSAPLHVRQFKVNNTTKPAALPVFAAALIVVVAYHKVNHFDFSAYATHARSQGADMLGLLHLGHEVQWEAESYMEDLQSWATIRADGTRARQTRNLVHYFDDYKHFDFVLRQHFSPAYAKHSMYLPLGPNWGWQMQGKKQWLPKASQRKNFCLAALWRPLDFEYHWDRGKLLELLVSDKGRSLCTVTGKWVSSYYDHLIASALSLCPFGSSPETGRLWESLLAGAVVVMTRATFVTAGLQAPFILLNDWQELPALLQTMRSSPGLLDKHQEQQSQWFNAYMKSIRHKLKALGRQVVLPSLASQGDTSQSGESFGEGPNSDFREGGAGHATTVLLHQDEGLQAEQLTEHEAQLLARRRSPSLSGISPLSDLLTEHAATL